MLDKEPLEPGSDELVFIEHTYYMFDWSECYCLIKADCPTQWSENLTLEEALTLIGVGYRPLPF